VDGDSLAFAGPRRHGDGDERKRRAGLGAKLKRRSERDGERRAGAQRLDSLQTFLSLPTFLPTPDAAPPAHDKPDFLNGSMGHRMRDGAGRQFEMRHAAAAKAQQQAHGGSVRRRRVRRSAQGLGFEGYANGYRHRSASRGSARLKPRSSWRGDRLPAKRGYDELNPSRRSGA